MPADALHNWRAAGKWEQAVQLAEGQMRSDLERLVELEAVTRRRPADQRKRLTAGERKRLVQLLDAVERLPRSGTAAASATVLPLVILPGLGPGLRPASSTPTASPGPGQGPHRAVLRPPRDGVPETDARLQRAVEADRRAAGAAVAG